MSKTKNVVREGYIEFTGLRFFLQKMEGRMSRKELVELIRSFFTDRGLKIEGTLKVEFRMTRRPTGIIDGVRSPVVGSRYPCGHRVEIFLESFCMTRQDVIRTVAHELDHEVWEMEGREFDRSLPYINQVHEIQARATGTKNQKRYGSKVK